MLIGRLACLRRVEKEDLPLLWKWHEERELALFERLRPLISYEELHDNFSEHFKWRGDFLILASDKTPVGLCSFRDITWKNRTCDILFQALEPAADLTVLVDALETLIDFLFDELDLLRLTALIPERDALETQVLEQSGFILEGRLKEHLFSEGRYQDVLVYGRLKAGR